MLLVSALVQWILSRPGTATTPSVTRALADLAFATGGPGAPPGDAPSPPTTPRSTKE
jgi:hypothetical protein